MVFNGSVLLTMLRVVALVLRGLLLNVSVVTVGRVRWKKVQPGFRGNISGTFVL